MTEGSILERFLTGALNKKPPNGLVVERIFQLPYVGWEMDNDFAACRLDGERIIYGTDHGRIKQYSLEEVMSIVENAEANVFEARQILGQPKMSNN